MRKREIEIPVSTGMEKYGTSVYSQFRRPYYEEQAMRAQVGLPIQHIVDYIVDQVQTKGIHARRAELDAIFNSGC